jgi:hypothetical protein
MNLKNAAFLALVGTLLFTILLAADFINTTLGVVRDVIPLMALIRSSIYLFAGLCVTWFFYAYHRSKWR